MHLRGRAVIFVGIGLAFPPYSLMTSGNVSLTLGWFQFRINLSSFPPDLVDRLKGGRGFLGRRFGHAKGTE